MKIELATEQYEKDIIILFNKYLNRNDESITKREFLCEFGLKAAIKRKQVMIVLSNYKIIAAMRFYLRKRDNIVSIYQFAIDENHIKQDLLQKMLYSTGYTVFDTLCHESSKLNKYYKNMNWILKSREIVYNRWYISLK